MISRESPMYRVVLENLQLLPLLPRFNLKPGFGELSVDEVCHLRRGRFPWRGCLGVGVGVW